MIYVLKWVDFYGNEFIESFKNFREAELRASELESLGKALRTEIIKR